jgi:hypothetical protein
VQARTIRNFVPSLLGRVFGSWEEWFDFIEQYQKTHLVCYRTRDSLTVAAFNKDRVKVHRPEEQLPSSMMYARRKY